VNIYKSIKEKNVEEEEEGDTLFQWTVLHWFLHCVEWATGNVFKSFIQNYIKALQSTVQHEIFVVVLFCN